MNCRKCGQPVNCPGSFPLNEHHSELECWHNMKQHIAALEARLAIIEDLLVTRDERAALVIAPEPWIPSSTSGSCMPSSTLGPCVQSCAPGPCSPSCDHAADDDDSCEPVTYAIGK